MLRASSLCLALLALLALTGCRSFDDGLPTSSIFVDDLQGATWQLVDIDPSPPMAARQARATAQFSTTHTTDGTFHLTGYTGCNEYYGSYEQTEDGRLRISALGATRRFCAPGTVDTEHALLNYLPTAQSFKISDNTLTIYCAEGVVFEFRFAIN